jgi:hypothetical protein
MGIANPMAVTLPRGIKVTNYSRLVTNQAMPSHSVIGFAIEGPTDSFWLSKYPQSSPHTMLLEICEVPANAHFPQPRPRQ